MFLAAETQRFEARIALIVENERTGCDFDFVFAVGNGAFAVEIEADFDAVWMEAPRPVEVVGGMEFVPLEAEAEFAEAAKHRPPASPDSAPRGLLRKNCGSDDCWFARELFHSLTLAQDGAGGGAVGAVADFNREADEVVVARLHVREDEAFDDPDFWTKQCVVCFDTVLVKASHREVINTNSANAAIGDVTGGLLGDVDEVFVEGWLHRP